LDELYNRPERLLRRYEQLSTRLGEEVALGEELLSFFGYEFLHKFKEPEKAARYFEMNAGYYPRSPNVWNSLGEMYATRRDVDASVRMYEKVLSLDPGNEHAARKLKELRGK
jgi:tetratricopeptide (TPR) repeat protein